MENENVKICNSIEYVYSFIRELQDDHVCSFSCYKKTNKNFGTIDFRNEVHTIYWEERKDVKGFRIPFTGEPFMMLGKMVFDCEHAPLRKKKVQKMSSGKTKFHKQDTKKLGCPAQIIVKEVVKFPDFRVSIEETAKRNSVSKKLHALIQQPDLNYIKEFYIQFPKENEHQGHTTGETHGFSQRIDPRISNHIGELVTQGVTDSNDISHHLRLFLRQLFPGQPLPSRSNRRYYPSKETIRNHVKTCQSKLKHSKDDQENLQQLVDRWEVDYPEDNFLLRTKTSDDTNKFLFVYQTKQQKYLLERFGNLALLDATYKTTKYDLPLFFLAVKTNVDYQIVATFIVESETTMSIVESLEIIKEWNPHWQWRYFMTDFDFEEINAISMVFEGSESLLCDFHREQSWERWCKKKENGVSQFLGTEEDIIPKLREIAHALTPKEYAQAVQKLKKSSIWQKNKKLSKWFTNNWLKHYKKWSWAYRREDVSFCVHTNNGIETQHKILKYDYLRKFKDRSVSGVATVLVEQFLPDRINSYTEQNVKSSCQHKKYSSEVPEFLVNRPANFVENCLVQLRNAKSIDKSDINQKGSFFVVQSQSDKDVKYDLNLGSDTVLPKCQCIFWRKNFTPCKHMFAVLQHFFNLDLNFLPSLYTEHVYFTLDPKCISHDDTPNLEATHNISPTICNENVHDVDTPNREATHNISPTICNENVHDDIPNLEATHNISPTICNENVHDDEFPVHSSTEYSDDVFEPKSHIHCADLLKVITADLYNVQNKSVLGKFYAKLQQCHDILLQNVVCEGGLKISPKALNRRNKKSQKCPALGKQKRHRMRKGRKPVTKKASSKPANPTISPQERSLDVGEKSTETSACSESHIPGIRNYSNNCWFNSSIQAIHHVDMIPIDQHDPDDVVVAVLQQLLRKMKIAVVLDPSEELNIINDTYKFVRGAQQDPSEFLTKLLPSLVACGFMEPITSSVSTVMHECQHSFTEDTFPPYLHLQMSSNVGNETVHYGSVREALCGYLEIEEEIPNITCPEHGCSVTGPALRKPTIISAGEILVIMLNRCVSVKAYGKTLLQKVQNAIGIDRYLQVCDQTYSLQALQCHYGHSLHAGHYTTYVIDGEVALRCDDMHIIDKVTEDILKEKGILKQCYILWYKEETIDHCDWEKEKTKSAKNIFQEGSEVQSKYNLRKNPPKKEKRQSFIYPVIGKPSNKYSSVKSTKEIPSLPVEIWSEILLYVALEQGYVTYKLASVCKMFEGILSSEAFRKQHHRLWCKSVRRNSWDIRKTSPEVNNGFIVAECFSCGEGYVCDGPGEWGGNGIRGRIMGISSSMRHPGYCSYACKPLHAPDSPM